MIYSELKLTSQYNSLNRRLHSLKPQDRSVLEYYIFFKSNFINILLK